MIFFSYVIYKLTKVLNFHKEIRVAKIHGNCFHHPYLYNKKHNIFQLQNNIFVPKPTDLALHIPVSF